MKQLMNHLHSEEGRKEPCPLRCGCATRRSGKERPALQTWDSAAWAGLLAVADGMTVINSPCVNVCRMQGNLCLGCYRTLDEIAGWSQMSDAEKQQVLSTVAERSASVTENSANLPAARKKSG